MTVYNPLEKMRAILSDYLDTPAAEAIQDKYGESLEKLEDATVAIVLLSATMAIAFSYREKNPEKHSERLNIAYEAEGEAVVSAELLSLLQELDAEVTRCDAAAWVEFLSAVLGERAAIEEAGIEGY